MKTKDFYEFLQFEHADDYMGNGDDMGEACDEWIGNLDPEELIDFADLYAHKVLEQFKKDNNIF